MAWRGYTRKMISTRGCEKLEEREEPREGERKRFPKVGRSRGGDEMRLGGECGQRGNLTVAWRVPLYLPCAALASMGRAG